MCDINWSEVFEEIDTNGNGVVEVEELFDHLSNVFPSISRYTVESDLEEYDTNKDGEVTKAEFVRAMYKRYLQNPDDIELALKTFDTDNSGYLSKEELTAAMKKMCMDHSSENIQKIITSVSKNDQIDYKEFVKAAMEL
ncbi:calcium-dependent protein kinase 12-like [Octopus sinensis]|uniref:Calcium-dependent protein kinase 12-like n=1 Tax=Octopus sinensis TaxID=2607531 RepID=A0A6P7SCD3_9MOLL|nr:calcium-dependent protein kinase 12-like [Octopus sinensis]